MYVHSINLKGGRTLGEVDFAVDVRDRCHLVSVGEVVWHGVDAGFVENMSTWYDDPIGAWGPGCFWCA